MSDPGTGPAPAPINTPPAAPSDYNATQATSFLTDFENELSQPPVLMALGFGGLALLLLFAISPSKKMKSGSMRRSTRSITIKD